MSEYGQTTEEVDEKYTDQGTLMRAFEKAGLKYRLEHEARAIVLIDNSEVWFYFDYQGNLTNVRSFVEN